MVLNSVLTIVSFFFFSFLLLLKGLMGPEGKDGPPGLQGLRVSDKSFPSHPQLTRPGAPISAAQRSWCQLHEFYGNIGSISEG